MDELKSHVQRMINAGVPEHEIGAYIQRHYKNPTREMSTITAQPVPTSAENLAQSGEAMKTIGPIVGDIAMTAAAPQLKGAGMGIKGLNMLLRSAGAGAGSGAGSVIGQKMAGGVDMAEAGKETIFGLAGEPALSIAGAPVKFAAKKLAKPALELVSDVTLTGSAVKDKIRKSLIERATKRAQEFAGLAKTATPRDEAGFAVGSVLNAKKDYGKAYASWNAALSKHAKANDGRVYLDDAEQILADKMADFEATKGSVEYREKEGLKGLIEWLGFSKKNSKEARLLQAYFKDGYISEGDARYLMPKLWNWSKGDPEAVKAFKDELKGAIIKDIDIYADDAIASREAADKIFKGTIEFFKTNPRAAKSIEPLKLYPGAKRFEQFPETVVDQLKLAGPEEIKAIKGAVMAEPGGAEAWAGVEYNLIKDIFDKAITQTQSTGKTVVQPYALAEAIESNEQVLKAIMPHTWKKLKAEADYFRSIAGDFEKQAKRQSIGPVIGAMGKLTGGVGAAGAMGIVGIPIAEGFGAASAYALMTSGGKKALAKLAKGTAAVTKAAGKAGLHVGGRAVFMDEQ